MSSEKTTLVYVIVEWPDDGPPFLHDDKVYFGRDVAKYQANKSSRKLIVTTLDEFIDDLRMEINNG